MSIVGGVLASGYDINPNVYAGKIQEAEKNIREANLTHAKINLKNIQDNDTIINIENKQSEKLENYKTKIKNFNISKIDVNTTIINTYLEDAKTSENLQDMSAKLEKILQIQNINDITTIKDDIDKTITDYEEIKKIKGNYDFLLDFVNSLEEIENSIDSNSIRSSGRNISAQYTTLNENMRNSIYKDEPFNTYLFQDDETNWILNRANFFNEYVEVLSKTSGDFNESLYHKTITNLKDLKGRIGSLKLEPEKEKELENDIDKEIYILSNGIDENKRQRNLIDFLIILAGIIATGVILFVLYYIFFLSNKRGGRRVVDETLSRFLDGRTLLVFKSNKYGTLFHPKEVEFYANSDVGLKRELNEDSIGVTFNKDGSRALFALADGMGGHNAGEVASRIAIQTIIEEGRKELLNAQNLTDSDIKDILRHIVYSAHENILNVSKANPEMSNMGTTLETVFLDRGHLYYAHVGDSRVYMTYLDDNSEERIQRVTRDHSELGIYMERYGVTEAEARTKVPSNVITQAVGITSAPLNPDIDDFNIGKNNWILVCSDGLSDMVQDDSSIGKIIIHRKLDVKGKVNELIRAAKDMGGKDNISVILFRRR